MQDSYRHKGLRRRLVQSLRAKGIRDERILAAFEDIPRHFFMDSAFAEQAYQDKPFPIGKDQTISQPYTVASQTELLEVAEGHQVLEIGTGSGFQAAVLAYLGAEVYSIERFQELRDKAAAILYEMQFHNVRVYQGDGTLGLPRFAPYDRILVTAGMPRIPEELLEQLAEGAAMVVPVGNARIQKMMRIRRTADQQLHYEEFNDYSFVPAVGKAGWGGRRAD